jgi:hypothetical protein
MGLTQPTPTRVSITPRSVVSDLERAFTFYERMVFRTANYGGVATIVRNGVELHVNHDPDLEPGRRFVCRIRVTKSGPSTNNTSRISLAEAFVAR